MERVIRFTLLLLVGLLLLVAPASAAPVENDEPGIQNGIFTGDYNRLPDDTQAHYMVDISDAKPGADESGETFMDSIKNFNPVQDTVDDTIMQYLNVLINVGLQWNMMMTNLMIGMLNFGFETQIISSWIDAIDGMIVSMAGLTGTNISGGLFGALIGFAVVAASGVAMYQIVAQRATTGAVGTLTKSVLALAIAFALFANFGAIMKGMNEISTEISATMLTGTANTVTGDNRSPEQIRKEVSANLWNEFIGRPYLILQYGHDDVEKIGPTRVNELLALPKGDDRQQYVDEQEIEERGNTTMTYASVIERLAFTGIYSIINAVVSLPIYALSLALIIFQLWFLMMAFIAPFALIQAAFPGQFGVLKRYAVELTYPLVCKVIATVATLFIFTLGFMIYSIDIEIGIARYFVSAFMQFALFGVFFFARKRIAKVLTAGNRGPFDALRYDIVGLKTSMNDAANKIGSVGKMAASVGVAAATGGTSTIAGAATAVVASQVIKQEGTVDEPTFQNTNHSKPMSRVDAADTASASQTTTPASKPLTTIQDSEVGPSPAQAQQDTKEQKASKPVATIEKEEAKPLPKAETEAPAAPEQDLSKPLARINDVEPAAVIRPKFGEKKKQEGDK